MDQKDINLLSMKLVESRNYIETKKNVDEEILYKYEEYKYKCHEILPPKISQNFEVRYESFTVNFSDKVGNYVQKKLDLIQKADEFYNELAMVIFPNFFRHTGLSKQTICLPVLVQKYST